MSLLINLTPAEEARLSKAAKQDRLAPAEFAAKLLRQHLALEPMHSSEAVRAKLRQWQKETKTETSSAISAHELFAHWTEEDAQMTDDEKDAEDRLWQDFEKGVNETRAALSMRQL